MNERMDENVSITQADNSGGSCCWVEHLEEWNHIEETGVARDFSSISPDQADLGEFINPTMMRPGSDQWHLHFTSNPIAAYLPFDRY